MPILRGEDVIMMVGSETARGTAVVPTMSVPGRSPSGIRPIQDRVAIKETRGFKLATSAEEIIQKRAEGDFEMNVRVNSIGFFLKSLLGSLSSVAKIAPNAAVFDHTFRLLEDTPEHPSLTFGLHQKNIQDYTYRLGGVSKMEFELTPTDLIMAKLALGAAAEAEKNPAYAPDFTTAIHTGDHHFRHQDVTIKIAANVAGLGAAPALKVKSLNLTLDNGLRPDQNVTELNPGNMLVTEVKFEGKFELDYQDKVLHDLFDTNANRALQILMVRSDITIGTSANPSVLITFPRITFNNWEPSRPIEEVVREALSFTVLQSPTEQAIEIVTSNLITTY